MAAEVARIFPDSTVEITKPRNDDGHWWLDAKINGQWVTVQWIQSKGFGLTAREDVAYGTGADEFIVREFSAMERLLHLLRTGEKTVEPAPCF